MPKFPSGTVTFLFTDVERSTETLARLGADAYTGALETHHATLRRAFAAHGGAEVDTQGDSFFVAFARARDAVAAAREGQAALADGPLRVRMGVHTGEPLLSGGRYTGMDVHRAARIAAAGHGGQVLLSQATRDLLEEEDVVDLGEHRLKDLTRRERIFQLGHGSFPPLASLNRSTLPEAANPLVGRRIEQRELTELVRQNRLVTITGAGGTGKTRLALQIAGELTDDYLDGVFFVSLASVSDPELVLPLALETLGENTRRALVVLDNFEHVLAAAPAVAAFLRAPGPTLLVTSRAPLHLTMEHEYALDPLPEDAAVEMFLDRARTVRRGTEPSETVESICRRLDGLPLALELAAARLKLLDPESLLTRLDVRLPLLTRGSSDLPERQRTLEATIAWSYDLLEPAAREIFARLSVFSGTFGVEAADEVAGADLEALTTLVDASLLKPRGDSRFLMLETIREFARNRLSDAAAAPLPKRHAAFFLALAEAAAPNLTGPDTGEWLDRLAADQGNLRAALDWFALEQTELLARLAIAQWRFWLVRGRFEEGQRAIERALRSGPTEAEHAELVYALGAMLNSRGHVEQARSCFQEAFDRFRAAGSERGEARSLSALGHVASDSGRWAEAIERYEQAAALCRRGADRFGLAGVLGDLASAHLRSGSQAEAFTIAMESVELQREQGNGIGESLALATAGYAKLDDDLEQARALLRDSTRVSHRLGYLHGLVFSLNGLAAVAYRSSDPERAAALFRDAHALRAQIGIAHDPDDALVADLRAHVLPEPPEERELDVDRAVAAALG